ncbi:S-scoulerine 9-O-methyltransferase-like protein [Cinnamomum micranthum f. kanehirae]|uniref:S-scoulerine 9-O-methyltransferase-like protein n=1 Tax=Cinnamomum micranthum f. kanehirae TaxID=337451 RepID=A0A443PQF5_9MAGN|nr:S-scoulerine 9-O-methyltransferase-like protein [Cinnamomum micranthum f. kanehirae]
MATQDHPNRLYGIDLSSVISFLLTLRAAIQPNVFQIIADAGPDSHLSSSEIAAKLPTTNTHAPAILDRILRVLAANSALTMSRESITTQQDGVGLWADERVSQPCEG